MTECGMVFVNIIKSVCWTKGWGTNGYTERYPSQEHKAELDWLVDNGYLFHFQKRGTHSRYRIANYHISDMYGITAKGWSVAGKYVDSYGVELEYQQPFYPKRKEA